MKSSSRSRWFLAQQVHFFLQTECTVTDYIATSFTINVEHCKMIQKLGDYIKSVELKLFTMTGVRL